MNYYPQRALFSGAHDPKFGAELTELVFAVVLAGICSWFFAERLSSNPAVAGLLAEEFSLESWVLSMGVYAGSLMLWAIASSIVRRRPGWGASLFVSGLSLPLVPMGIGAVLSTPISYYG